MILLLVECQSANHCNKIAKALAEDGVRSKSVVLGESLLIHGRFAAEEGEPVALHRNGDPLDERIDSHPPGRPPANRVPPSHLVPGVRPCPLCGRPGVPEGAPQEQMCQACAQGYAQVNQMPINPPAPPTPDSERASTWNGGAW